MTLIHMLSVYLMFNKTLENVESLNDIPPSLYRILVDSWTYLTISSLIVSGVIILLFCFYGLYFSNRIAGPIYQVRKAINQLLSGNSSIDLRFRKNDYFQELSEPMNQLIKKYSK